MAKPLKNPVCVRYEDGKYSLDEEVLYEGVVLPEDLLTTYQAYASLARRWHKALCLLDNTTEQGEPPGEQVFQEMRHILTTRNAAKCLQCQEIVESEYQHDFVRCSCGNVAVDGGTAYRRRVFKTDQWEEVTA
jgi:hypothetical protein